MNNRDRGGPLWLVWLVANRVVFKRAVSGDITGGAFEIEAIPVEMKPAALSIKTGNWLSFAVFILIWRFDSDAAMADLTAKKKIRLGNIERTRHS